MNPSPFRAKVTTTFSVNGGNGNYVHRDRVDAKDAIEAGAAIFGGNFSIRIVEKVSPNWLTLTRSIGGERHFYNIHLPAHLTKNEIESLRKYAVEQKNEES